jgi:hypothetical protein
MGIIIVIITLLEILYTLPTIMTHSETFNRDLITAMKVRRTITTPLEAKIIAPASLESSNIKFWIYNIE